MLIQTFTPEHYVMNAVLRNRPDAFVSQELSERKAFGYPPFTYLAMVLVTHEDSEHAQNRALECLVALQASCEREQSGDSLLLLARRRSESPDCSRSQDACSATRHSSARFCACSLSSWVTSTIAR